MQQTQGKKFQLSCQRTYERIEPSTSEGLTLEWVYATVMSNRYRRFLNLSLKGIVKRRIEFI